MCLSLLSLLLTIPFFIQTSFAQDLDPHASYRLINAFFWEARALDTYSDGKNDPFMGKTGDYSGQLWKITPAGHGFYRLTNEFLGAKRSLDTYSDG